MEDFNPVGLTRTAYGRALGMSYHLRGAKRPLLRDALLGLFAVALVVRALKLDTSK